MSKLEPPNQKHLAEHALTALYGQLQGYLSDLVITQALIMPHVTDPAIILAVDGLMIAAAETSALIFKTIEESNYDPKYFRQHST